MKARLAVIALAGALSACMPSPPPRWAEGGALLDMPRARWVFGEVTVEVDGDGDVKINGSQRFKIDRAGRVYDDFATPVALLDERAHLAGPNHVDFGTVGTDTAALPGEARPWIELLPSGEVARFDEHGARHPFGQWYGGCRANPSTRQTCTLITHLMGLRFRNGRFEPGGGATISFGFGGG
ncbi:MAG TPA: hypothetical protein VGM56_05235 [Byssovorax sp.]|jgi:hypothetical protein